MRLFSVARRILLLGCVLFASAEEELRGQIRGRVSIPAKFQSALSGHGGLITAKVIVDGGKFSSLPTADGYFIISGIPVGLHLLQVVHPVLRFDPVLVEAHSKGGVMKLNAYLADFERGKGAKLKYPLGLAPSDAYAYLEKREEFNILSIFRNPMFLMGLFSFCVMFLLPKLQPMLEEEKERQRQEAEALEKSEKDGGR
mmetsp:Transcript_46270/g.100599  ORF Transcript_46270/g.100599 Transcript_46270/m.100599 type:complete len:199 (+) Transcript_46270:67-663(+)